MSNATPIEVTQFEYGNIRQFSPIQSIASQIPKEFDERTALINEKVTKKGMENREISDYVQAYMEIETPTNLIIIFERSHPQSRELSRQQRRRNGCFRAKIYQKTMKSAAN